MALPLLDSNIVLRHLLADHPELSPRATAYIQRIEQGALRVRATDLVVFETVFTLRRSCRVPKAAIRDAVLALLELPGIVLPGKRRYRTVFELYVGLNISFADAYHAVLMQRLGLTEVISFDREVDRVPGLTRVTP